jgi:hypothetical protein
LSLSKLFARILLAVDDAGQALGHKAEFLSDAAHVVHAVPLMPGFFKMRDIDAVAIPTAQDLGDGVARSKRRRTSMLSPLVLPWLTPPRSSSS